MATIHANNANDALTRLENMATMAVSLPVKALRQNIVSALSIIVQASRLSDGKRKTMSILEITGMEGDIITTQEIFKFHQTGVSGDGDVIGQHKASGVRPRLVDRLEAFGNRLPDNLFQNR